MANSKGIFKKPPVVQVEVGLGFLNVLEVADYRSKFHSLVKNDFPSVIMPEQKNLVYDFGDYMLYSQNSAHHLEISMGFRLITKSYGGYAQFRDMFLSPLSKFAECYGVRSFTQFVMQYRNSLTSSPEQTFQDFFSIDLMVPENLRASYYGARGLLLFRDAEDFITVELDPEAIEDKITAYRMNLGFIANRQLVFHERKDDITHLVSIRFTQHYTTRCRSWGHADR